MESIAIIGAGLTGLTVADALRDTHRVAVFEKSRGLGGRLSTRRVTLDDGAALTFDHGTPLLRPDAPFFSFLRERCSIETWDGHPPVYGAPSMSALVNPLADGVDMHRTARVGAIEREGNGWHLRLEPHEREGGTATGREGPFDRIVIAIPAHQARRLLEPMAVDLADRLAEVTVAPCWTLMANFAAPQPDLPVELENRGDVQWLICERTKPHRQDSLHSYVLQMKAEWSRAHLDRPRDEMVAVLMDVLRAHGASDEPRIAMAHRWLYSQTETALGEACLASDDGTLIVGGDWCLGPYAQDAWASANAVIKRLR